MDLVKPDPGLRQTNPEPLVYRCRKCRRVVAAKSNIIKHTNRQIGQSQDSVDADVIDQISDKLMAQSISSDDCNGAVPEVAAVEPCIQIFFVEPLAWMDGVLKNTQGKLNCPKCKSKLGNFNWTMGCNCPCGVQVSPAFYLVPSKVELCHTVQNVQITV